MAQQQGRGGHGPGELVTGLADPEADAPVAHAVPAAPRLVHAGRIAALCGLLTEQLVVTELPFEQVLTRRRCPPCQAAAVDERGVA